MSDNSCCANCKYSRTANSLTAPVGKTGTLGYYFYCIHPGRKNALVFEKGICGFYNRREGIK
ncbi:MAG: hypothetical protein LBC75_02500 [Fibromonadaceae bacterium]|jgi:hypothetical protein|nr:hypothetical protein [Fibromonadaceae bacterium]